ncbi:MAG: F0F1 ATP synthase subunit delta [Gammaproteobacteria bacterium]
MKENNTLARPYAKAAFAYAEENKQIAAWAAALAGLASVVKVPEMDALLRNPKFTCEQILQVINACLPDLTSEVKNFIHVLANNHRLMLLPTISDLFAQYKAETERTITVQITSAFPLADAQRDQFAKILSKNLERQVYIESDTDEKLIGGAIIRAGDKVIDGSVRGRLMQLADSLMNG